MGGGVPPNYYSSLIYIPARIKLFHYILTSCTYICMGVRQINMMIIATNSFKSENNLQTMIKSTNLDATTVVFATPHSILLISTSWLYILAPTTR